MSLTTPTKPLDLAQIDHPDVQSLIRDMWATMLASHGVGVSANQVGVGSRIAVIDTTIVEEEAEAGRGLQLVLINPEVIESDGEQEGLEGCLSLPGERGIVKCALRVTVRAWNERGEEFEVTGEGLLARALRHECDHLDGKMFTCHLEQIKRGIIEHRWKRKAELAARGVRRGARRRR